MRLWIGCLLSALCIPVAFGEETLDLVAQHKAYGFQGVAMILGAFEKSDQSAGDIQRGLSKGGLGALKMPLSVHSTLEPQVVQHGEVGRCDWSWGVHCHVDVTWKTQPPKTWGARCVKGTERLDTIVLKTVIIPKEVGGHGEVQIDGVQRCWAAGGDSLQLTVI